jgi:hypothetical protein
MKTKIVLPLLGIAFSIVFGYQTANAQDTSSGDSQSESVLSGSALRSEDVLGKADAVFVGEIEEIGFPTAKAPGRGAYYGVQVKVSQVLRGTVAARISVTLYTVFARNERPPKVGGTYIFFAHKNTEPGWDNYTVLKLVPATDASTAKINGLITAPAAK